MSRPTEDDVHAGRISWGRAMYELHREIDKLDQELEILRAREDEAIWIIWNGDADNGGSYESIQEWHRRALAWFHIKEWP